MMNKILPLLLIFLSTVHAMDHDAVGSKTGKRRREGVEAVPIRQLPAPVKDQPSIRILPNDIVPVLTGFLTSNEILNLSVAVRDITVPCLVVVKERIKDDLTAEVVVHPRPRLLIRDIIAPEPFSTPEVLSLFKYWGDKVPGIQKMLVKGLAEGVYGFEKNLPYLKKLSQNGCENAHEYLFDFHEFDCENGEYERERMRLANLGVVAAQKQIISSLNDKINEYYDTYWRGRKRSQRKGAQIALLKRQELADRGWEYAQESIVNNHMGKRKQALIHTLAHKGWKPAQEWVVEALLIDHYTKVEKAQVEKVHTDLRKYVEDGWGPAQSALVVCLVYGQCGFKKSLKEACALADKGSLKEQKYIVEHLCRDYPKKQAPQKIIDLAMKQGWKAAQKAHAKGLAFGMNGFKKDHEALRAIVLERKNDLESPYLRRYLKLLAGMLNRFDSPESARQPMQFLLANF